MPSPAEAAALAGRVLMVGLPGPDLDPETAAALRRLEPAGVILFSRNLDTPDRATELVRHLRHEIPGLALIAIDQEGGRVSRLRDWVGATPEAARFARAGRLAAFGFAASTAGALRALGINLDFAPVVDLSEPGAPNGIGDRSFGTEPGRVVELAGAIVDGLQAGGVAACLKHFPGLGPTTVDSHETLPVTDVGREALDRDLEPFLRLGPRTAAVMVGHASYSALDAVQDRPASLSPTIVGELLRGEIGYGGLVVSDDLEMGAVAALDRDGAAAVASVDAGCDLVLYCSDLDRAAAGRSALGERARNDARFARRLESAARAVGRAAATYPLSPPTIDAWARARREMVAASRLT